MKKKVLDITKYNCPIAFIKAKDFLKRFEKVKEKVILIKGLENHNSLVQTLKTNYKIKSREIGNDIYEINFND